MGFIQKTPKTPDPGAPSTKKTGDWGEQVAVEHLVAMGCAIRERQWRGLHYEIDIIAQKGTRLIFVEVKTRKTAFVDPVKAVNAQRRHHMIAAADFYLKSYKVPLDYQFDIIAIIGDKDSYTVEHVPDAFFPTPRQRRSL